MPAELRLHRIGNLTLVELERDVGEFRHHLVLGEVTEIAAFGSSRILRLFLGERGEVRALFQLVFDRLGFVLGGDQDMARVHFLLVRHLLDRVFVDLVHRVVGHRRGAGVLQQGFHQHLVALELDAVLDVVAVGQLLLLGGLRQDDDVGEIGNEVIAFLVGPHLRHVGADLVLGQREVALADVDAVGAGDDRIGSRIGILGAQRRGRPDQEGGERKRAERAGNGRTGGGHKTRSHKTLSCGKAGKSPG